jgi:hypothetical protein
MLYFTLITPGLLMRIFESLNFKKGTGIFLFLQLKGFKTIFQHGKPECFEEEGDSSIKKI